MADHVHVTGTGWAGATPDLVVLDVRVQVDEDDVASALAGLTARLETSLAAAAAHGVAEADRRTTGTGVAPRWDREGQQVVGYRAHQSLRLRVRDRERVGEVVTALAEAAGDALAVDSVGLELSDPAPLLVRARDAAFADARARAEQYATLAGRTLGDVRSVREVDGSPAAGPSPKLRMAAADSAGGLPVEGGESTVSVSVRIRFGLGPA